MPINSPGADNREKEAAKQEALRGALKKTACNLLDNLSAIPEAVVDEIEEKKEFVSGMACEALRTIADDLNAFIEKPGIKCSIRTRVVREDKDRVKITSDEDPGIFLKLTAGDGSSVEVNIYGGLRLYESPGDFNDSTGDIRTGRGHTDRTDNIIRHPTLIGITMQDDKRTSTLWLEMASAANSSDHQFIRIQKANITEGKYTSPDIPLGLNYPFKLLNGITPQLRTDIVKLQRIRGVAY